MKTQLSKPARCKASYTDEYKQPAWELWRASARTAAKADFPGRPTVSIFRD